MVALLAHLCSRRSEKESALDGCGVTVKNLGVRDVRLITMRVIVNQLVMLALKTSLFTSVLTLYAYLLAILVLWCDLTIVHEAIVLRVQWVLIAPSLIQDAAAVR